MGLLPGLDGQMEQKYAHLAHYEATNLQVSFFLNPERFRVESCASIYHGRPRPTSTNNQGLGRFLLLLLPYFSQA